MPQKKCGSAFVPMWSLSLLGFRAGVGIATGTAARPNFRRRGERALVFLFGAIPDGKRCPLFLELRRGLTAP